MHHDSRTIDRQVRSIDRNKLGFDRLMTADDDSWLFSAGSLTNFGFDPHHFWKRVRFQGSTQSSREREGQGG